MRRGKVPRGLIGMLALVAAIEAWLSRHDLDFARPESWNWKASGKAARREAVRARVLCLGTSRAQQAIVPRIIEERSGLRAWNLSLCWGQAPASYFLLRRTLDAGARPSAVMVEYHPQCLAGDHRQAMASWPELLGARELLDLSRMARDASFFAEVALALALPSIRERASIRDGVSAALRGKKAGLFWTNVVYLHNARRNAGAIVVGPNPAFRGEVAGPAAAGLLPASWSCNPINEAYIRRLLDLASARGIAVYWIMPPFCPGLQEGRERRGLSSAWARFARRFLDRYPNLIVVDAERSGYGASVFFDPAHLDRRGACTLSADLGDLLRRRAGARPGPRWVELPPYRDVTPAALVEDLDESRVAVAPRTGARR